MPRQVKLGNWLRQRGHHMYNICSHTRYLIQKVHRNHLAKSLSKITYSRSVVHSHVERLLVFSPHFALCTLHAGYEGYKDSPPVS